MPCLSPFLISTLSPCVVGQEPQFLIVTSRSQSVRTYPRRLQFLSFLKSGPSFNLHMLRSHLGTSRQLPSPCINIHRSNRTVTLAYTDHQQSKWQNTTVDPQSYPNALTSASKSISQHTPLAYKHPHESSTAS